MVFTSKSEKFEKASTRQAQAFLKMLSACAICLLSGCGESGRTGTFSGADFLNDAARIEIAGWHIELAQTVLLQSSLYEGSVELSAEEKLSVTLIDICDLPAEIDIIIPHNRRLVPDNGYVFDYALLDLQLVGVQSNSCSDENILAALRDVDESFAQVYFPSGDFSFEHDFSDGSFSNLGRGSYTGTIGVNESGLLSHMSLQRQRRIMNPLRAALELIGGNPTPWVAYENIGFYSFPLDVGVWY